MTKKLHSGGDTDNKIRAKPRAGYAHGVVCFWIFGLLRQWPTFIQKTKEKEITTL
ncbi:MAG: hypothetical protein LBP90_02720 [Burkholderiales bacterium]|nr:hypothetical protein [Burkholderiales bacterium]